MVTAPLPFLSSIWLVAIGLFVAGIACSPVLISGMALVERIVPGRPAHRVDDLGDVPGIAVGIATATPLAGVIIDRYGARPAYWVTSGCAVGAFLLGCIVYPSLRRALAAADSGADPGDRRRRATAAERPIDAPRTVSNGSTVITQVP